MDCTISFHRHVALDYEVSMAPPIKKLVDRKRDTVNMNRRLRKMTPIIHFNDKGNRFCRTTALEYLNTTVKSEVTCGNCKRLM